HVERGERKSEVHDRHVLPVAQHDDVGDDHERGREPESERHPCNELKPTRSHPQSLHDGGTERGSELWSLYEAQWLQPVATGRRRTTSRSREIKQNLGRRLRPLAVCSAWQGGGRRFESVRGLCKNY